MQSQKISNFFSLQNPLVKKKNKTQHNTTTTRNTGSKNENSEQSSKSETNKPSSCVGSRGGRSLCQKENSNRLGMLQPYTKSTKHRTNLSSYYWNGVLVYNLWLIFYSDILDLNSFLVLNIYLQQYTAIIIFQKLNNEHSPFTLDFGIRHFFSIEFVHRTHLYHLTFFKQFYKNRFIMSQANPMIKNSLNVNNS